MSRRILLGDVASAALRHVVGVVAALALFPIVVRALGADALGTWTILGTASFLLGLCDLGLSSTLQRRALKGEDPRAILGWAFFVIVAITPIVAVASFAGLALPWKPTVVAAVAGLVSAYAMPARGLLLVRGGMRTLARAKIAASILQIAVAIGALRIYRDLTAVAVALLVANTVELIVLRRALGEFSFLPRIPRRADIPALKSALREGGAALVLNVSVALAIRIDVLVLARSMPLAGVAAYAVGSRVVDQTYVLAKQASAALVPRLGARGTRDVTVSVGTRLHAAFVAGAMAALVYVGEPLLVAWVGRATVTDVTHLAVILLGSAATIAAFHDVACTALAIGADDAWIATRAIGAGALVNVVLTISLAKPCGPFAVAGATVVGNAITCAMVWRSVHRVLGWSWSRIAATFGPGLLVVGVVHALGAAIARVAPASFVTTILGGGALVVVAMAIALIFQPARPRAVAEVA